MTSRVKPHPDCPVTSTRPIDHNSEGAYRRNCRCPQARRIHAHRSKARRLNLHRTRTTDATGTRRRIEALGAIGWSHEHLGARLGVSSSMVGRYRRVPVVLANTETRVKKLYEQLSMTIGPSQVSARRAAKLQWPPPLSWDDNTIDDPHALPRGVGVTRDTNLENDVARLAADGMRTADIARTLGRHQRVVAKVRARVARDQAGAA